MALYYSEKQVQREMGKYGISWFKFDEPSGNVTDSKGDAVGVLNGATRIKGVSGNALNFTSGDNVVFSSKPIPLGKKSIRFKFKKDEIPNTIESILNDAFVTHSSSTYGNFIGVNETGSLFWILYGSFRAPQYRIIHLVTTINVCDGYWHDILLTWDGTTSADGVKIYVDDMNIPNITQTATSLETTVQSNNLVIGKTLDTQYLFPLTATIDELEIYNDVIDPFSYKTLILSENNAYTLEDGIWVNKGLVPDNPEERDDFYLEYGFEETDATRDKLNELKNILPNGKGKISVRRF